MTLVVETEKIKVRIHPGQRTEIERKEILTNAVSNFVFGNLNSFGTAHEQRSLQPVCADDLAC